MFQLIPYTLIGLLLIAKIIAEMPSSFRRKPSSLVRSSGTRSALRLMNQRLVSGGVRRSAVSGLPAGPVTPSGLLGRSDMIKDSSLGYIMTVVYYYLPV